MKKNTKNMFISILMPVYNGGAVITDALQTILNQDYTYYEIIICDDGSTDNTKEVVNKIKDKRIKYFKNKINLGYGMNMERCRKLSSSEAEIIFLLAQDDLLQKGILRKINDIFLQYPEVGGVIRPFFMFGDSIDRPIRDFPPYNEQKDTIVSVADGKEALDAVLRTVCQLSGLAFRKSSIKLPFSEDVMTSHIYPFLDIFKREKVMYMKDYTIAVRTYTSQTRSMPKIYEISPTQAWLNLIDTIFYEKRYTKARKNGREFVIRQGYVGLVQLKNFSTTNILLREYYVLLKNKSSDIFNPRSLAYIFITFFTPRFLLLPLVDFYKEKVLGSMLQSKKIHFTPA